MENAVSDMVGAQSSASRGSQGTLPRALTLLIPALLLTGLALTVLDDTLQLAALAAGLTFLIFFLLIFGMARRYRGAMDDLWNAVAKTMDHDSAPCFGTDVTGAIQYRNTAATKQYRDDANLADVLAELLASPGGAVERMAADASRSGSVVEELKAPDRTLRLSAHRMATGGILWRVEDKASLAAQPAASASGLPMMRVAKPHRIIEMNDAMRAMLGSEPTSLDRVVSRLPLQSGEPTTIQTSKGPADVHFALVNIDEDIQDVYIWPEAVPEVEHTNADAVPVPILRMTPSGRILMSNARAQKLLAMGEDQDLDFAEVIEGLGRPIDEWLLDVSEGRGAGRTEVVRAALPQQDVYLQVSLGRMVERGKVSILAVLIDATELKTLEAQFVQSQKMQAIGQLAGGVAHDFNNLLTAISGHCDLLLLRHEPGDPNYGDLIQINQNANRAASLVGQLLAFSRKQNLQPELIDLRETLVDLTHLLNRLVGERINLRWSHDPDLPRVRADKRQLEQVIMNLVVNARDAMPSGGTILVETTTATLRDALQRDRAEVPPGDYVIVKVRDEGCGIASDKLQKIFEPFYSTKTTGEGTGLGLSMAYGIVKQSGGFIFADSTVGKGSTFTMYFPAHYRAATSDTLSSKRTAKALPIQDGGNVLLVEDEAPVRAFASRALRLRGYNVTEAACAEDALELLDDPEMEVDIFVTDVVMPGMDGPTWVAKALESRPNVKVVFVSGYAEDSVTHNRAKIPNSSFLPKPFSLNQLTETVQEKLQ